MAEGGIPSESLKLSPRDQQSAKITSTRNEPIKPGFLKELSKRHAQKERDDLAKDIRAMRKREQEDRENKIKSNVESLREAEDIVANQPAKWFINTLADEGTSKTATANQTTEIEIQKQDSGLEKVKKMLVDFYEVQRKKWEETPYEKEDLRYYFSDKHLARLTLEEYAILLRRFPSEMVAHVTRQGIRDHLGGDFHTEGVGEFSDGFMQILSQGRLKSHFGIYLKDGVTKEAIARCLELGKSIKTKKDALTMLKQIVEYGQAQPGTYADRSAVHFTAEEVADSIYGSEVGNEIFFTFPSAYIASQHFFYGQLTQALSQGEFKQGYLKHNDQWVWSLDQKGIALNTGLIFIPAEARVDQKTGSRYALDENKKPIERHDYIELLRGFINSENFAKFYNHILDNRGSIVTEGEITHWKNQLAQEFGVTDPKLQEAVLNYQNLTALASTLQADKIDMEILREYHGFDNTVRRVLRSGRILYQESDDTIPSKEFWENYFNLHPEKKPIRIVYYKGQDPTQALREWRELNGITKKSSDSGLNFSEHSISPDSPEATLGIKRFNSIARQVIDEYFDYELKAA